MGVIDVVERELHDLGYHSEAVAVPGFDFGKVATFQYTVSTGRYRGRTFRVGVGFQDEGYPEYPPHFVFVAELPHARLTKYSTHRLKCQEWSVFSLPPSDFWDRLAPTEKNMKTYVHRHLTRVWRDM